MAKETGFLLLSELPPRHCGLVVDVSGEDDDHERLMAMGVCAGRSVEMVQRGDPLILKVYGTRVGVSARLADRVRVLPCAVGSCPVYADRNVTPLQVPQ